MATNRVASLTLTVPLLFLSAAFKTVCSFALTAPSLLRSAAIKAWLFLAASLILMSLPLDFLSSARTAGESGKEGSFLETPVPVPLPLRSCLRFFFGSSVTPAGPVS